MSDWEEVPLANNEDDWEVVDHSDLIQAKEDPPKIAGQSGAQTALEHFGKGASLGYLPQLQAGAETAVNKLGDAKDKILDIVGLEKLASIEHQLRKEGFKLPDETYLSARDAHLKRLAGQKEKNPWTAGLSELAGGISSGIASSPLMGGQAATAGGRLINAAKTGAAIGIAANPGDTEGELSPVQLKERAINGIKGGAIGLGVQGGAEVIGKAAPFVSDNARKAGLYLKKKAEQFAENATGATGKQASEFADDAGRQLLDRKIVRFGDSQEKIAERAGEAVNQANKQIDDALGALEAKGVKVDRNKIYSQVREKINQLKGDESQADIAKLLENELDNVINAAEVGGTDVGISQAEQIKRGFNRKAGNWADPEKGMAGKEMYQTYRGAVEDAAQAADPATAALFEEGKKSYGLLAPIKEAAERRASTTGQSPAGGFLDMTTAAAGLATGGAPGAVAAPIARRVVAPRITSSLAVGADKVSKMLLKSPKFAELAAKNPKAFTALVANFSNKLGGGEMSKVAGPGQQPVDEDKAREAFLDNN